MCCRRCLVLCCSCWCVLCVILTFLTTSCLLQEVYSTLICDHQDISTSQQSRGWFWSSSPDPCEMIYSAPSQDASGSPLTMLHQRLSAWILYFNPHGNDSSSSPVAMMHLYLYDWLTYIIPLHTDASSSPVVMLHEHVYDWIFNGTNEIETCIKTNPNHTGFPFQAFVVRGIVITFSSMIAVMLSLMITTCIFFLLCKRSRNEKEKVELTPKEQRDKQRVEQELEERRIALHAVKSEVKDTGTDNTVQSPNQEKVEVLPECGCRLQKYWLKQGNDIITTTPISKKCTIDLKNDIEDVRSFLGELKHDFLQPISDVKYVVENDKEQVVVTQPFRIRGSIRDIVHEADPMCDWGVKYKVEGGIAFSPEEVAKYGKQVLDAMLYLYKQDYNDMLKLSPLGHVHTGNIFVEGGVCRLGGYENTLLGYRTRLYRKIEKSGCLESIDVIMFGHVIYEMSTGKELEGLVPNQNDINIVWDEGCREILKFIFKRRTNSTLMQHSIRKIRSHEFFSTEIVGAQQSRFQMVMSVGEQVWNRGRETLANTTKRMKNHYGYSVSKPLHGKHEDTPSSVEDASYTEDHADSSAFYEQPPRRRSWSLSRRSPQESNRGESRENRRARSESPSRVSPDGRGSRERHRLRSESPSRANPQESDRGESGEKHRARSESPARNGQSTLNDDRNESSSGSNSKKQLAEENVSPVRNDQSLASNDGTKPNESRSQVEDGVRRRERSFTLPRAFKVRLASNETEPGKKPRERSSSLSRIFSKSKNNEPNISAPVITKDSSSHQRAASC